MGPNGHLPGGPTSTGALQTFLFLWIVVITAPQCYKDGPYRVHACMVDMHAIKIFVLLLFFVVNIYRSSQCSTTGVTKVAVCVILSVNEYCSKSEYTQYHKVVLHTKRRLFNIFEIIYLFIYCTFINLFIYYIFYLCFYFKYIFIITVIIYCNYIFIMQKWLQHLGIPHN